ncbi:alpha-beta hydrolase superfamily lysophospholipase [Flavobacteriaceae bacterium MAR_2010_72]|nr:alpha-beta hydrolase superfamily lysophospholipase [Flavobacteriaceae bacterium MAR_2010_72]
MKQLFTFNVQNIELFGQYWQPQVVDKVVVLVHGLGEHSSRYERFVIPELNKHRIAVVAFDLFGHGRSKGKKGHVPSYELLMQAIDLMIKKAEILFPNKPIVLYGHSLGGNLVINYALRNQHNLKGVIASSPFLRLAFQPPKWKMILGKILLKIIPSLTMPSELDVSAISRDDKEVKRYVEDALVHDKVSPMFTFPVIDAGAWAIRNASTVQLPMLLLHGTGDRITDYKASVDFCNQTKQAQLVLLDDGFHELHNDICKNEFMESVLSWLKVLN